MSYLRIKEIRKKKKLTQKELGDMLSLSASAIGMYEQGRRKPDLEILIKMSALFEIPLDMLVIPFKTNDELSLKELFEIIGNNCKKNY